MYSLTLSATASVIIYRKRCYQISTRKSKVQESHQPLGQKTWLFNNITLKCFTIVLYRVFCRYWRTSTTFFSRLSSLTRIERLYYRRSSNVYSKQARHPVDFKCAHKQFCVTFWRSSTRILIWLPIFSRINNCWFKRFSKHSRMTSWIQVNYRSSRKYKDLCPLIIMNSCTSKSWISSSNRHWYQNFKLRMICKYCMTSLKTAKWSYGIQTINQLNRWVKQILQPTATDLLPRKLWLSNINGFEIKINCIITLNKRVINPGN